MAMDPAALSTHIPSLRRYARALTGDPQRADDLVQDTLERALRKGSLWRAGSDLRAWLFTLMHNLRVNDLRADKGLAFPGDEDLPEIPSLPTQQDRLAVRDLDRALARLPVEQREVLLLVGLEDLSYGEAAKVLGVPIGTVMSRLSRGRERLQALLEGGPAAESLRVVK